MLEVLAFLSLAAVFLVTEGVTDAVAGGPAGTVWGQLILLLTTIVGFVYAAYRDHRTRQWSLQDRAEAKKERAELAKNMTDKFAETRTELVAQVRHTGNNVSNTVTLTKELLVALLESNTDLSKQAFTEANNVNSKIAELTRLAIIKGAKPEAT